MSKQCLCLICPPAIEDSLLDILLDSEGCEVFTNMRVFSHGAPHTHLSSREQVMGRSDALMFQVVLEASLAQVLLERIRTELGGSAIRYWATPLSIDGEIK